MILCQKVGNTDYTVDKSMAEQCIVGAKYCVKDPDDPRGCWSYPCRIGHSRGGIPFNSGVDAFRPGARAVAVALPNDAIKPSIPRLILDGIQVVGTEVGTTTNLAERLALAADGKVVLRSPFEVVEINPILVEMELGKIK